MKVFVPIKRVPDWQTKLKVSADGAGIVTDGIKWIVNPFDEIAIEEALRLKEGGKATEVVVVAIGPDDTASQLRYAMAMGADSAVHVKYAGAVDSDVASRVLAAVYKQGDYGLVVMGKQGIDSDAGQTAQMLAYHLDLPHASFASKVILDAGAATVTREVDGGLETVKLPMPCVISTDLRLNEPRYASLPNIMKAKKKPLQEVAADSLGVDLVAKVRVIKMAPPEARKAGRKVKDLDELIAALQTEAKVL